MYISMLCFTELGTMRQLDKFIRYLRVSKALKEIGDCNVLMDLGGYDSYLLMRCKKKFKLGILVDPLVDNYRSDHVVSVRGDLFHAVDALLLKPDSIDIICMLAVFEHLGNQKQQVMGECAKLLKKGGRLIITAPHEYADYILRLLRFCKMINGMSLDQHDGCSHADLMSFHVNSKCFKIIKHERFQFWLNNLYVFEKI